MKQLTEQIKSICHHLGASSVGIVSKEMLSYGPPTTDITSILPEGKTAVCFAVPLDQSLIDKYLGKKDQMSHHMNNMRTNTLANGIALEVATYLKQKGFISVPVAANNEYRNESTPPLSHRYLAVRSGVGWFGLSGNLITPKEGASVILGTIITAAELEPTNPLPVDENFCDNCGLCKASCASGYIPDDTMNISIGGLSFSFARRQDIIRCVYVCGGYTGLHPSGRWSTWSPGRFLIPEDTDKIREMMKTAVPAFFKRGIPTQGIPNPKLPGEIIQYTCGNCQLICHPDKEIRKNRYRLLTSSGVIIEDTDGKRHAVSPEKATEFMSQMSPERRSLYEM